MYDQTMIELFASMLFLPLIDADGKTPPIAPLTSEFAVFSEQGDDVQDSIVKT